MARGAGSFGARPLRAMRHKLLTIGPSALPVSWRKKWTIQRIIATPPWADFVQIRAIYKRAGQLTEQTGVLHTVDHEIPLNNPRVCGLHTHENLRVMPAAPNYSKSNGWCQWHGELFDQPEQLRIQL